MFKLRAIIADDEPLARERVRTLLTAEPDVVVEAECSSGEETLAALESHKPDLLLLDIQMPALDGFEVLRRTRPDLPATIFITAYDQFAIQAFELHALDYLLKPFRDARFKEALERARQLIITRNQASTNQRILEMLARSPAPPSQGQYLRRIAVKAESAVSFIPVEQIDWLESARNYVVVHTGATTHLIRENLGSLQELLDPAIFLRASRFALVNSRQIQRLEPGAKGETLLFLKSGAKVPSTLGNKELLDRLQRI